MPWQPKSNLTVNVLNDFKSNESWRLFRIISEFTEGVDELEHIGDAISIFGSARL